MQARTCGVIMEPFIRALGACDDLPAVQIVGGNASSSLLHESVVIDLGARTIQAPAACDLPRLRADNSLRDLDTLVLSTDDAEIEAVRLMAEQLIGAELKINVFGLKTLADLEHQRRRPMRSTARIFLGDRYVAPSHRAGRDSMAIKGFKALYPFQVPIDPDSMETFSLTVAGRPATPVPHPGATILNYLTRSISGLRAKDTVKVELMTETVLTRYPEIKAWIVDGPGRDTLDLARILHTLSEPRGRAGVRRLGTQLEIIPYSFGQLDRHPGFMAADRSRALRRLIIGAAHAKSRALAGLESQPTIVTLWQKHVEDRVGTIIHNEP